MQTLAREIASRVRLPRGFNQPFRTQSKHIKGYIMEKLLNLIWVGASLACH
jgi:hypothetical protein